MNSQKNLDLMTPQRREWIVIMKSLAGVKAKFGVNSPQFKAEMQKSAKFQNACNHRFTKKVRFGGLMCETCNYPSPELKQHIKNLKQKTNGKFPITTSSLNKSSK